MGFSVSIGYLLKRSGGWNSPCFDQPVCKWVDVFWDRGKREKRISQALLKFLAVWRVLEVARSYSWRLWYGQMRCGRNPPPQTAKILEKTRSIEFMPRVGVSGGRYSSNNCLLANRLRESAGSGSSALNTVFWSFRKNYVGWWNRERKECGESGVFASNWVAARVVDTKDSETANFDCNEISWLGLLEGPVGLFWRTWALSLRRDSEWEVSTNISGKSRMNRLYSSGCLPHWLGGLVSRSLNILKNVSGIPLMAFLTTDSLSGRVGLPARCVVVTAAR